MKKVFIILFFLTTILFSVPAMASDIGNDAGMPQGNTSAPAVIAPQITQPAIIAEVTPIGRNLSEMIKKSGPYNGLNPTIKVGESYVRLSYPLNGTEMYWQQGHFTAGWYRGFLEEGEWVYAWWVCEDATCITYKLSRGRCGNPAKPQLFKVSKPVRPQAVAPIIINTTSSTTTTVEKKKYIIKKEGPKELSFAKSGLVLDRMPETVLGPRSEVRAGLFGVQVSQEQARRPCPTTSPYCPPSGGAPADPGGNQIFDNPDFVPGLSDQHIDR